MRSILALVYYAYTYYENRFRGLELWDHTDFNDVLWNPEVFIRQFHQYRGGWTNILTSLFPINSPDFGLLPPHRPSRFFCISQNLFGLVLDTLTKIWNSFQAKKIKAFYSNRETGIGNYI